MAFALRVAGLGFGLPDLFHQDEPSIVNHALSIAGQGWNTGYFVIPPFSIYSLFILYGKIYVIGKLAGVFANPDAFAALFFSDPGFFYLAGRLYLGAVLGTLTVAVVMWTGWKHFSPAAGLAAGAMLAVTPMHVEHSHYIYADIPVTLAVTLLLNRLFALMKNPDTRRYLWMGAVLGWAVTAKYTAAYFLPAVAAAHIAAWRGRLFSLEALKNAVLSAAAALLVFTAIAPYTFLDWGGFWAQIVHQAGAEPGFGPAHHFVYSILGGTHPFVLALAFWGVVKPVMERKPEGWVLGVFILAFYAVNAVFSQAFARYMLPLVPALCLAAGVGWEMFGARLVPRTAQMSRALLIGALVLSMGATSVYLDKLFLSADTRTAAREWFEANVEPGTVIVVDSRFFGPHLAQTEKLIRDKYGLLEEREKNQARLKKLDFMLAAAKGKTTYETYAVHDGDVLQPFLFLRPVITPEWKEVERVKAKYVVVNSTETDPVLGSFKEQVRANGKLVKTFSPYRKPDQRRDTDPHATTAAPHLAIDVWARKSLGPYLEIYKVD